MILNMGYGAKDAAIVDFTLASDFVFSSQNDTFTINNVGVSGGAVHYIFICKKDSAGLTLANPLLYFTLSEFEAGVSTGALVVIAGNLNDTQSIFTFAYDEEAYTLDITETGNIYYGGYATLTAGDYRLVIW